MNQYGLVSSKGSKCNYSPLYCSSPFFILQMAYGYRRRYTRRPYRRAPMRRSYSRGVSRPRQMNDNETRVMSFTSTMPLSLNFTALASSVYAEISFAEAMAGTVGSTSALQHTIDGSAGRVFYAMNMFDRVRCLSHSVSIRPSQIPQSAFNMQLWACWDRYADTNSGTDGRGVTDDPSSKQVTWTTGGNGAPLSHKVTRGYRDQYQYLPIIHTSSGTCALPTGRFESPTTTVLSPHSAPFWPWLRLFMSYGSAPSGPTTVLLFLTFRYTVEFSGSFTRASGSDLQALQSFHGSAGRDEEAPSAAAAHQHTPPSAPQFQYGVSASKFPQYPQFPMSTK